MSRFRDYFIVCLLLVPLLALCGKVLLTPFLRPLDEPAAVRKFYIPDGGGPPMAVRGWPWIFLKTVTYGWPPPTARMEIIYISWLYLLADLAVLSVVVIGAAAVLVWHRRRRGAWLRFSLRELLVVTATVAAPLGWWMCHQFQWRREQQPDYGDT